MTAETTSGKVGALDPVLQEVGQQSNEEALKDALVLIWLQDGRYAQWCLRGRFNRT